MPFSLEAHQLAPVAGLFHGCAECFGLGIGDGLIFLSVENDGRRRAGIIHLPWQEVTPNWLPYVNVEDPAAMAKRVEELGGQVLIPPRPDIRNGSVGIVTDPSGAAFAIQKWPVDDEETGGTP